MIKTRGLTFLDVKIRTKVFVLDRDESVRFKN